MSHENYLYRKNQIMKTFDKLLARVQPSVSEWFGEEQARQFAWEARQEYEELIPRIPYIGESSLALSFFLPTTRYLAVYRALQKRGRTVEEAGRLIYRMGTEEALAMPPLGRRIIEVLWFSWWFRRLAKKRAIKSQRRMYPANFVENYVEGDGREFDFGIDYIECANCKFLQAENAFEIAPYVCATDKPTSELMGWGLTRPQTIADGFPICGFRFKKGGATNVPVPQSLLTPLGAKA
ncbi:MAG TPA: L-2-amino-thiazoline-4-carboxylic acid hydrolase [Anaerolineales bacterium]|nr:L-2-amino-thiazoline-4-carboxylic acid hydrolase [Anaerolineales bacterium]